MSKKKISVINKIIPTENLNSEAVNKYIDEKLKTFKNSLSESSAEGSPASRRKEKLVFAFWSVIVLLIAFFPLPKDSGGEFEISSTPATNTQFLRSSIDGIVKTVHVKTGQEVNIGDPIVSLLNWDLAEKRYQVERDLSQARADISRFQADISGSRADYARSKANSQKFTIQNRYLTEQVSGLSNNELPAGLSVSHNEYKSLEFQSQNLINKAATYTYLAEEGVYPEQLAVEARYEAAAVSQKKAAAEAKFQNEKSNLNQSYLISGAEKSEADMLAIAASAKISASKAGLQAAKSRVNSLERLLELYGEQEQDLSLQALVNGKVLTLNVDLLEGQNFPKGEIIATVGDLKKVKIQTQLPEKEIAYIEQDNEVIVRVTGVPNKVFKGNVSEIAPITSEVEEITGKKRIFEVSIVLDNPEYLLKPGMTGYAVIKTDKKMSLANSAWNELYSTLQLSRYINRNPFTRAE